MTEGDVSFFRPFTEVQNGQCSANGMFGEKERTAEGWSGTVNGVSHFQQDISYLDIGCTAHTKMFMNYDRNWNVLLGFK